MQRFKKYIIPILLASFSGAHAQETVHREVRVVKPYEPVISDAFKISELPKIVDTTKVTPEFEYEITPVRTEIPFNPAQIQPARLISEPLTKLYYGYAKAGFGTYLSPLAELYLGSKRNEDWRWNVMANYRSTNGKIKNEQNQKVYAGNSWMNASFNGERFLRKAKVLSFGAEYLNQKNYYYGYNPEIVPADTTAPLLKEDMDYQDAHSISAQVVLATNYLDSAHVNYKIKPQWQTFLARNNIMENALKINTNFDYFFEREFIGADVALNYYKNSGIEDTINGAIVKFSPWVGAFGNKWRIVAGVTTYYDQMEQNYSFFPRISMHYNIIDYFLIPYFEFDGKYQENSYQSIYTENPYIRENLGVTPTETKMNITFGFRGNISSKISFNAKVNYSDINNQYFYVNDTSTLFHNRFDVVYDDITRIRLLGEVSYKSSEKLFVSLKGNYYHYQMENEQQPWHMPTYNLSFNARYTLQDKIIADINVFGIGTRYAKEFDSAGETIDKELQGIIDLNFGLEYRLSKVFSAFARFNNISSVKYYKWNNYPTHRFNVMLGLTYSF